MDDNAKVNFFNSNFIDIFKHEMNESLGFINECSDTTKLEKVVNEWPDEIKLLVVDRYLAEIE